MEQLTKGQALKIFESKVWEKWTDEQIVKFQLYQDRLCVPFGRFHEAIAKVLKRPVFSHEFAYQTNLIAEFENIIPAPSFQEIIELIPEEKRILIKTPDSKAKGKS